MGNLKYMIYSILDKSRTEDTIYPYVKCWFLPYPILIWHRSNVEKMSVSSSSCDVLLFDRLLQWASTHPLDKCWDYNHLELSFTIFGLGMVQHKNAYRDYQFFLSYEMFRFMILMIVVCRKLKIINSRLAMNINWSLCTGDIFADK